MLGGVAYTPQAPQETRTAGPPSRGWAVENGDMVAPGGAVAAHQAMQGGGLEVPASGLGCPVPMQGTSAVQLHGLPMQAVVEASCGMQTLGSTGNGVRPSVRGAQHRDAEDTCSKSRRIRLMSNPRATHSVRSSRVSAHRRPW